MGNVSSIGIAEIHARSFRGPLRYPKPPNKTSSPMDIIQWVSQYTFASQWKLYGQLKNAQCRLNRFKDEISRLVDQLPADEKNKILDWPVNRRRIQMFSGLLCSEEIPSSAIYHDIHEWILKTENEIRQLVQIAQKLNSFHRQGYQSLRTYVDFCNKDTRRNSI